MLEDVDAQANVDDIIETANHFKLVDYMLDVAEETLTEDIYRGLKEYYTEKGYLVDTCLNAQYQYQLLIDKFLGD